MYLENEPAMKRDKAVVNDLTVEIYTIKANCKIQIIINTHWQIIQAAQNQKQINAGGLTKLFELKTLLAEQIMLAVNIDKQDGLINCQTGIIRHTEFAQGSVHKVHVRFSVEQTGSRAMRASYLGRQYSWFSFEKSETENSVMKVPASPSIKYTQFLLALATA